MTISTPADKGDPPRTPASRWPTALSAFRLAAGPVVAALVLWADARLYADGFATAAAFYWAASALFGLAALSDALDGWLARHLNAVTPFGAALDHAADKALVTASLIALVYAALTFPLVIAALIILVRDIAVAGLREGMMAAGRTIPVSALGKIKTIAEMTGVSAALLLQAVALTPGATAAVHVFSPVAHAMLWMAAATAVWSGVGYVLAVLRPRITGAGAAD